MRGNTKRLSALLLTLTLAISLLALGAQAADREVPGAVLNGSGDVTLPEIPMDDGPVTPGKVSALTVIHKTEDATKITLTWKAAENAASYQVERSTDGGSSWKKWTSTEMLTCSDSKAAAGKTYRYRVSGVSADGTAGTAVKSKKVSVHLKPATDLTVTTGSSTELKLTWKGPAGAGWYEVYRDGELVSSSAENAGTVGGLSANTEYTFRVVAGVDQSDKTYRSESDAVSGKTGMKAPKDLKCRASKGKVLVSWKKVDGAKSYEVYRKEKKGAYQRITTTKSVKYTDKKVKVNRTYYYKVRAKASYAGADLYGDTCKEKKVTLLPLSGCVVCVDAGHGNNRSLGTVRLAPGSKRKVSGGSWGTSGVSTGVSEATLTLKVAKRLRTVLEDKGAKVVMVRTKKVCNLNNVQRCQIASKGKAELTIRLHADGVSSSSVKGISMQLPGSTYCSKSMVKKSASAGNSIYKAVLRSTGAKGRGQVKRNDLVGFNWSKNPSVLLEMGFMSNPSEDRLLQTAGYQKKIVKGIVNGTVSYFK